MHSFINVIPFTTVLFLTIILYTSMISIIVTYLLWYHLYNIYNSKVYNIYSRSASLYTTFCVLSSLSFSSQIALMFDTEVTLDTATENCPCVNTDDLRSNPPKLTDC